MLTAASLASVARETCARRVPAALRIEPATGTLAAYDHAGRRCPPTVSWSAARTGRTGSAGAGERCAPVPADAVDAAAFRALSARAGRG
ncbi:MAG: hypothetical protein VB135_02420 [Burkholderia sp.]